MLSGSSTKPSSGCYALFLNLRVVSHDSEVDVSDPGRVGIGRDAACLGSDWHCLVVVRLQALEEASREHGSRILAPVRDMTTRATCTG